MSDDQFTKLFRYIEGMRVEMNAKFDDVNTRFDTYTGAVDAFAKQSETFMQEFHMLSHQVDRHDSHIHHIAHETGVELAV